MRIQEQKNFKCMGKKGVTLISLVVTIIVLLILAGITISTVFSDNGIISKAKYTAFATKIAMYKDTISLYSLSQALASTDGQTSNIYVNDPEKMKEILGGNIDNEEAGKYGIQDNELRYKDENVTNQEREWLIQLGVLAMGTVYLITFISNGTTYKTIWTDKVKFPAVNPTSDNGEFAGWYYDIEGTRQAQEGEELLENINLYAKWEKTTLKFMIDTNTLYQEMKVGDVIDFPAVNPTSTKGNFKGWYYDENCTKEAHEGETLPENMTLYAKWENFKIIFMANGEKYSEISNDENKVVYPTDPTNAQGSMFTFNGWYDDENSKFSSVGNGEIVTKDTILYAGWKVLFDRRELKLICAAILSGELTPEICELFFSEMPNVVNIINEVFELDLPSTVEGLVLFNQLIIENSIEVSEENTLQLKLRIEEEMFAQDKNWFECDYNSKIELYLNYNNRKNIIKYELLYASVLTRDGADYDISDKVSIDKNGIINIDGVGVSIYSMLGTITIKVTYNDGKEDVLVINFDQEFPCLAEGTMITLSDMSEKAIEDIEYSDELLVWDFDNGCFTFAKPLWIKKVQTWDEYNYIKFEDGTELKTVLDHRIFNYDSQKFTYTMNEKDTPIGTRVFKQDGTLTKIIERKVIKEEVNYYNIITDYHMNLFANGLLTSLRLNNLYKIENMKFVKDNRKLTPKGEFEGIPEKYYYGLRLAEQPKEINRGNDVKHTNTLKEYVDRLLILEK